MVDIMNTATSIRPMACRECCFIGCILTAANQAGLPSSDITTDGLSGLPARRNFKAVAPVSLLSWLFKQSGNAVVKFRARHFHGPHGQQVRIGNLAIY